jgi:hypothetical protein
MTFDCCFSVAGAACPRQIPSFWPGRFRNLPRHLQQFSKVYAKGIVLTTDDENNDLERDEIREFREMVEAIKTTKR